MEFILEQQIKEVKRCFTLYVYEDVQQFQLRLSWTSPVALFIFLFPKVSQ